MISFMFKAHFHPSGPAAAASPVKKQTDILLSGAPLGGTMGSWRPRRPQTGVPDGLVCADPPRGFVLLEEIKSQDSNNQPERRKAWSKFYVATDDNGELKHSRL